MPVTLTADANARERATHGIVLNGEVPADHITDFASFLKRDVRQLCGDVDGANDDTVVSEFVTLATGGSLGNQPDERIRTLVDEYFRRKALHTTVVHREATYDNGEASGLAEQDPAINRIKQQLDDAANRVKSLIPEAANGNSLETFIESPSGVRSVSVVKNHPLSSTESNLVKQCPMLKGCPVVQGRMQTAPNKPVPATMDKRGRVAPLTQGSMLENAQNAGGLDELQFEHSHVLIIVDMGAGIKNVMAVPANSTHIEFLFDQFAGAGASMTPEEANSANDIIVIGGPDALFDGVAGAPVNVTNDDGTVTQDPREAEWGRFLEYDQETGFTMIAISDTADHKGTLNQYAGYLKKMNMTMMIKKSVEHNNRLLAEWGIIQNPPTHLRHLVGSKLDGLSASEIEAGQREAINNLIVPGHGAAEYWVEANEVDYEAFAERMGQRDIHNATVIIGETGQGKSETAEFKKAMQNAGQRTHGYLEAVLAGDEKVISVLESHGFSRDKIDGMRDWLQEQKDGLQPMNKYINVANGDDMFLLARHEFADGQEVLSHTNPEQARYARMNHRPAWPGIADPAEDLNRQEIVIDANADEKPSEKNRREVQRSPELEATGMAPMTADVITIYANVAQQHPNLNPTAVVQEMDLTDQTMDVLKHYLWGDTGSTLAKGVSSSIIAGEEFSVNIPEVSGTKGEHLTHHYLLALLNEQKRREEAGEPPVKFRLVNSGVVPAWNENEAYDTDVFDDAWAEEHLADLDGQRRTKALREVAPELNRKRQFAYTAREVMLADASDMVPEDMRQAGLQLEELLGTRLDELSYLAEHHVKLNGLEDDEGAKEAMVEDMLLSRLATALKNR